ncbi:hypothetical protein MBANPS3_001040 [Mucor bainieri]
MYRNNLHSSIEVPMMLKSTKRCLPFKSDDIEFPAPLMKFLNPFDLYKQHVDSIRLPGGTIYHGKSLLENNLFKPIGEKFLHCIVTNSDMSSWVLITELDVFISNRKDLDNCGYRVPEENTAIFTIKVTVEKNQGRGYSELVMQAGDYQIVATGGLYGNQEVVCGGFLGSSVPDAIGSDLGKCFTLTHQKEFQMQHRHLRDYKKHGAKIKGGFASVLFKTHGLYGQHPLWYVSNDTSKAGNLSMIASKILCHYINDHVTQQDINSLLRSFLTSKIMGSLPVYEKNKIKTVGDLKKAIQQQKEGIQLGAFAKTILYKLDIMEKALQAATDPTTAIIDINGYDLEESTVLSP